MLKVLPNISIYLIFFILSNLIIIKAGVVDRDYTGNVGVILFNFGTEVFKVNKHDRIAQLICEKIANPDIEEIFEASKTSRGENGFGSSGLT
jgi:dUTP pyrophosphatase